eukprot:TRINITY_DN30716_c0_g1_i1.p1 TRINITY_DN30716_c0_g1~~TRINITY_DN30716_c0_g1_i1.p1  ORF type:complete len:580 (-),score=138.74 TRINITY_DN30716_c0_g1_i1:23-1762(-)
MDEVLGDAAMQGADEAMPGMEASLPEQSFSLSGIHWAAFLALAVLVWWLWSSRSGGSGGGSSSAPHSPQPVDAEELRRKRLAALQASSTAAAAGAAAAAPTASSDLKTPEPTNDSAKETPDSVSEGLRKRAPATEKQEAAPADSVSSTSVEAKRAPATAKHEVVPAKPASSATAAARERPSHEHETKSSFVAASDSGSPETFTLRLRGALKGTAIVRSVDGLTASKTVEQLRSRAVEAFNPEAAGCRLRLFFSGKELKDLEAELGVLGITAASTVQVVITLETSGATSTADAKEPSKKQEATSSGSGAAAAASSKEPPAAEPLSIRVQGTLGGAPISHMLTLSTASTVADLESIALRTFGLSEDAQIRLLCMGKELKDPASFLGHAGFSTGAAQTVQVMFAPGQRLSSGIGQQPSTASNQQGAAFPSAIDMATALGSSEQGAEAVMAAAAAAGLNTSVLLPGTGAGNSNSGAPGPSAPASPAEAWRAMAGLEEQLAREINLSEAPSIRQASGLLRTMLTTATHGNNPALMQAAKTMIPDLDKIWNFEPTREHLTGLLAMRAAVGQAASSGSGSSSSSGS